MQSSPPLPDTNKGSVESIVQPIEGEKTIVVEPRFEQIKEDLQALFTIHVTSETSLRYPWVKDEFYTKVVEGLHQGDYATLDYMIREPLGNNSHLLTKEECLARGIQSLLPQALQILGNYKEPRRTYIKNLFVEAGIMSEAEEV
jgi:hypothetical protein